MKNQHLITQLALEGQLSDDFDAKLIDTMMRHKQENDNLALFKAACEAMGSDFCLSKDQLMGLLGLNEA